MPCSGGGATFSPSLLECLCPANTYLVERNPSDQTLLASKRCDTCISESYRGPPTNVVDTCIPCPEEGQKYNDRNDPYTCECDETNGWISANDDHTKCFKKTEYDQADLPDYSDGVIYYNQIVQGDKIMQVYPFYSQTMKDLYISAAMGCKVNQD